LSRGDFGVMCMTQNFKTTNAMLIGVQVMMASRTVTCAVAGVDVIHFAVTTLGRATKSLASIFCSPFGGRSSEPPYVIALPLAPAFV
jgi:hypothetical protein